MQKNILSQFLLVIVVVGICVGWSVYRFYKNYEETSFVYYETQIQTAKTDEKTGQAVIRTKETRQIPDTPEILGLAKGEKVQQIQKKKKIIRTHGLPIKMGLDLKGGVHLVMEAIPRKGETVPNPDEMEGVIKVMRARLDPQGVREVNIQKQGNQFISIDIPGEKDPEKVRALIGEVAQLEFLYSGDEFLEDGFEVPQEWRDKQCDARARANDRCVVIDGAGLKKASPSFSQGRPSVSFTLQKEAAEKFYEFTRRHVSSEGNGRNHYLAIAIDGRIISCPSINSGIPNGSGQITGTFTREEVKNLVDWLNSGALPLKVRVAEMRAVSPTLGKDSLTKSFYAGLIGLGMVVLFMVSYYRLPGLVACTALVMYITIMFGAMSMINAVLTLPGIAGFVLSIGMAVDANVIIFERLKEELRLGKTLHAAIEAGFNRAFTAILDSNVTTLIATAVLYGFGTGPIRGFAVTLSLGILASMFSAVMITRVIMLLIAKGSGKTNISLYGFGLTPANNA
jgi:preprotein translocase subunit SecD